MERFTNKGNSLNTANSEVILMKSHIGVRRVNLSSKVVFENNWTMFPYGQLKWIMDITEGRLPV